MKVGEREREREREREMNVDAVTVLMFDEQCSWNDARCGHLAIEFILVHFGCVIK